MTANYRLVVRVGVSGVPAYEERDTGGTRTIRPPHARECEANDRAHGGATGERRGHASVPDVETTPGQRTERVGVLVVRAVVDQARPELPLLRITRTLDVDSPLSEVSATVDPDEACVVLRRWLADLRARAEADTPERDPLH